jgi:hypothetical protein
MDTMYAAWNVWRADIVREMLARVDAIGAEVDEDLAELGNGPLQRLFQTLFGPDMEDGVTKLAELRMEMERLPIGDERSKATNRYFDAIAATESVAELKAELESLPEGRARHRAAALFLGVWDGADDTWNEPEGKMVRCAGESLEILCRA